MSHRKKEEDGMGHATVVPDLKLPHTTTLEL